MNDKQTAPCANSLFCCKENCLQRCQTIKEDLDSIKKTITIGNASRSLCELFSTKYDAITSKLQEIEDDFEKKENNFNSKKDILDKLKTYKTTIRDNKTTITLYRILHCCPVKTGQKFFEIIEN